MNPAVFEVNLYAVDVGYLLGGVFLFVASKNGVDIDVGSKFDFVLGYGVGGYPALSSLTFLPLLEEGKEQGYAYKGVASVVGFGIDYTAVAFSTDDSAGLFSSLPQHFTSPTAAAE